MRRKNKTKYLHGAMELITQNKENKKYAIMLARRKLVLKNYKYLGNEY